MRKILLYPFWIRFWHWFNALLFMVLIASGVSLHYSEANTLLISFNVAMYAHNVAGILLSVIYLFYITKSILSGNIKHYIPKMKGYVKNLIKQGKYYMSGIFDHDPKPFHPTETQKFNPMQQITYLSIMFGLMPIIIITGWALLFPEYAPNEFFGMGGVWPMAFLHIIIGFFLSIFMVGHIYLATTGRTAGELFKSMLNGWHLHDEEDDIHEAEPALDKPLTKKKLLPIIFYNQFTFSGLMLSLTSFVAILFLMTIEYFAENPKAYIGIIIFVVLPSTLIFGIILIIFGAFRENRKVLQSETKERKLPVIDLNKRKHQLAVLFFTIGSVGLIAFSLIGSYKAYEYTDSDEFCGTICHKVMEPEYSTFKDSPHAQVLCVKCHIGTDAHWTVKSKLSGLYQVYSVLFNKYSRPIPAPIKDLRPTQQTCEKCHWPKYFYSEKKINFDFFTSDEKNSETKLSMHMKTGGGSSDFGNSDGIHWHMNLTNEITYLSTDDSHSVIPWVKVRNYSTGKETIYTSTAEKISEDRFKKDNMRIMDCIDCHNRPSHIFNQPNKMVNSYLSFNKIDRTIPYIKNIAVQALEGHATSRETAYNDLKNFIWRFYSDNYPDVLKNKRQPLENSIQQIYKIYERNYFPNMYVNWKHYPNNIGHMYSAGCYRCHDGKHVSNEGKVISQDCNVCHVIISQQSPNNKPNTVNDNGEIDFNHPGGIDKFVKEKNCPVCHGVKRKQVTYN